MQRFDTRFSQPPAPAVTVLVTGVGDTVGQSLIKALRRSEIPCRIIGTDRDALSAGLSWVDHRALLPHCGQAEAYLGEMRRLCAAEGVQLIFPGSEKELDLLAEHADALRMEIGATVVGSSAAVLRVAMNKFETCRFLERSGLNFPQYARLDRDEEVDRLVASCGFPLIAKPFRGTGARGLVKIESLKELAAACGLGAEMVLQECLLPDEEEYSVEVYTLRTGEQVGSICYHRKHLVAGDTYKARIVDRPAAQAEACAVVAALGAIGPCNVQLRITERGPVTFEINPRFSGGVSMRAHFGFNEPEMAIRELALGQTVPRPALRRGVALRFWEELYLEDSLAEGEEPFLRSDPVLLPASDLVQPALLEEAAPSTPAIEVAPVIDSAASVSLSDHQPLLAVIGDRKHEVAPLQVLGTDQPDAWTEVLERTRQYDFHHLPQYHRVAEQRGEGTARLFVYQEDDHTIALPLLLRPVDAAEPGGWQDATSVYGYAGPVTSNEKLSSDVVTRFQNALTAELKERRVVSLFSRLHPLIEGQDPILAGLGECPDSGQTISIDLTQSADEQSSQYNKSCRASLKKLRKMGFVAVHDREKRYLPEFASVYLETMRRVSASGSYFLDEHYFALLTQELGAISNLFVVLFAGQVAAATLCTICKGIVQDHLGGTRDAFLRYSPDRLVVDTERLWAKEAGAKVFHLGGGVGAQQDSVFRYKAGFSDRRHTFRTWRWIIQPAVYDELCTTQARWNQAHGLVPSTAGFFPAYRCPTKPAENTETATEPQPLVIATGEKEGCANA